jgi:glycosyltransferase involved in cell wall biosynthesis
MVTTPVKLSVIIPCFNAASTIESQLDALARQEWSEPWEVIVVDNGSTDGSPEVVERYRGRIPGLRVVLATERRGPAHARNVGARAARGESLAFVDADDEVAPGWVAALGAALQTHEFVASRFDIEKLNPTWVQATRPNKQKDGVLTFGYAPYFAFCGCGGMGVRRALHEAVGGLDETLECAEDTDYCYRVQLAGGKLLFVPEAVVHIRYRATLRGIFTQALAWAAAGVGLHVRYRPPDAPRVPVRHALVNWLVAVKRLVEAVPHARGRAGRAAWVWTAGWTLGRLRGATRHRVAWPR